MEYLIFWDSVYLFGYGNLDNALRHVQIIPLPLARIVAMEFGAQLVRCLLCGMDLIVKKPSYAKRMMWRSRVFVSCSISGR